MKKLFFASVFALATLTACNNSESQINPEEQQHQTFQSKTTAREAETPDEKEAMEMAIEIIKKDLEAGGGTDAQRILCHTPYSSTSGHACVVVNNHLFNVSWSPTYYSPIGSGGNQGTWDDEHIVYSANLVPRCNC